MDFATLRSMNGGGGGLICAFNFSNGVSNTFPRSSCFLHQHMNHKRFIMMKLCNNVILRHYYYSNSRKTQIIFSAHSSLNNNSHYPNDDDDQGSSMEGVVFCDANSSPLTPISFLERAARFCGERTSLVYGSLEYKWSDTYQRCLKLASSLTQLGISPGDVVATLSPNVPAMYELHFAVPMAGAIICTLNSRLDASMVSVLLEHSQAKILFVDYQLLEVARSALDLLCKRTSSKLPILVLIADSDSDSTIDTSSISYEYEMLLANGEKGFEIVRPKSEMDPISINYTSGTTSRPKGVIFSHRGAYLNSLATVLLFRMDLFPVYLWTVPMFHCNGWCLPWGVAAQFGTNICLRKVKPKDIFDNVTNYKVTHLGGAPTVLNMIVNSASFDRKPIDHKVLAMTGGSPPPPQIIAKMEELGFTVSHLYGLTETYGPGTFCVWKPEWDLLAPQERSRLKARQGIPHVGLDEIDIKDPETMESVPNDGKTMGEVMFRGNTVMSGYLRDLKATKEVFKDGWFHSGDLGVKHQDGYIEIKDRLKDIIISGGENISSVEVETVLYNHPAVLEAAVVARPDNHWGQTPCAFVELKEGTSKSNSKE
ncbi:isovalerate--CoA ligase AAE2 isoform X2 [Arachis duranensis]|uniref:Isovalerate--CoA ligase AAE2 isoform X2 n=1 Tax=Arachis duranensis TaxID=130453 RepID=A0A6P5N6L0_ARADU|nr:isovalerate--CoA ligase AAE2 isoform X2 [Arachis duranensis]XP_052112081.1 isovalerate--CoA ligase AAE2 isoform X2 [Arachis duranensis]